MIHGCLFILQTQPEAPPTRGNNPLSLSQCYMNSSHVYIYDITLLKCITVFRGTSNIPSNIPPRSDRMWVLTMLWSLWLWSLVKGFVLQTQLSRYEWWRSPTNDFCQRCSLFDFLNRENAHVSMEMMGDGVKGARRHGEVFVYFVKGIWRYIPSLARAFSKESGPLGIPAVLTHIT